MEITARQIREGDLVTYCGATFKAAEVSYEEGPDLMKVEVAGRGPQYLAPFRTVEVFRPTQNRPFVALTRDYDDDGNADKQRFTFPNKGLANSWLTRTPRHVVFTNW